MTSRRYFIETWGCQMNELDSQRMAGQLMQMGLLPTSDPQQADVILLNSCSVREKAEQKVYSRLGEYRSFKKAGKELLIGLCGCVAQQVGERILAKVPDLDFVIGPGRLGELRDAISRRHEGRRLSLTGFPTEPTYQMDTISRSEAYKGMVTAIEGCDKKCTFCIVPQTRGPERSRRKAQILDEVRSLIDFGFLEVELLGQTINHWRDPETGEDFADLLEAAALLEGLRRLRFITSYPRDFSQRMIEVFGTYPNISAYLHLPIQSGSDLVLRRMGRGYSRRDYLDLIARIRRARPDVALSTDLIVGFPGETEEDFLQSLEVVREVRFANVFAFVYSPRPGTAALRLQDEVNREQTEERLQRVFALQDAIQRELNSALVGQTVEVIVAGWGRQPGTQTGRSSCNRLVHFSSPSAFPLGSLTRVTLTEALPHSLVGTIAAAT
jgi:tRNA-2-methylthio-N6-dimethylallyladenosine synthase